MLNPCCDVCVSWGVRASFWEESLRSVRYQMIAVPAKIKPQRPKAYCQELLKKMYRGVRLEKLMMVPTKGNKLFAVFMNTL